MTKNFAKVLPASVLALLVVRAGATELGKVDFNREVRPILSENCFACHGPDKSNRKAKLRLDQREAALEKDAFKPGKPEESELVSRVVSSDPEEIMPPPDSHKKLTAAQKATLQRWIAEGAEYQPHWSYITPQRPPVPANAPHPVDAFIRQTLANKKIAPSPPADRATLLRRLSLDLIGLPPKPEEVAAFLADNAPGAYERQVERLLASPQYGERMAVPWLDVARYADTVGYHGDQNARVFPYRDYVVNAFNSNKRFDQFTIEQLAGDLLPNATDEQRTATCFNRLNMMTREGGAQPKEYLAKYAADRVRTVSGAWLGSTLGCSECHDHKFDPFTAKDFYAMEAFFADVKQWGVYSDYNYTPNPDLKGFTNEYPFPPELEVTSPALLERIAKLRAQGEALAWEAMQRTPKTEIWKASTAAFLQENPSGWETPVPTATVDTAIAKEKPKKTAPKPAEEGQTQDVRDPEEAGAAASAPAPMLPAPFRVEDDGRIVLSTKGATKLTVKVQPKITRLAAIRVELLPDASHGGSILGAGGKAETMKVEASLQRQSQKAQPLPFRWGSANFQAIRYSSGADILGLPNGWPLASAHLWEENSSIWLLQKPLELATGDELEIVLDGANPGCVRISVSPLALDEPTLVALPSKLAASGQELAGLWLRSTGADAAAYAAFTKLDREIAECQQGRAHVMVTQALAKPLPIRLLHRGNWQDETGELMDPAPPQFLDTKAAAPDQRLTRLDLAKWLVAPENPLTSRVFVNRLWKQFFGTGLSAVVDDLGAQGEWPTHPELLDWLAVEFRESGWDVKHMVRLLVTSETYRQSANLRPELRDVDPNNRLLASQNPRRLEAEFVRDNALAIAGLLNLEMGGPAAHPYQPARYYENLQFPNREYQADADDRQYRRGLYTHWQRTFLHPMLANFDAPSREECTASRTIANTPQQALTLLNDPTFMEASRAFAAGLLSGGLSDEQRLGLAFQRALQRPVKSREQESLTRFLAQQREYYSAHPEDTAKLLRIGLTQAPTQDDPAELAAWTQVARVVLNLHETITRY